MKSLMEVQSFGAIAAEDDDIKRYFVQTPVFKEILSGSRQVVLGRKGSGKTALYLAVLDAATQGTFTEGLTFRDYPWALHAAYAYEATTSQERFVNSWQFLIYMELFKLLLTERDRKQRYGRDGAKALDEVEEFIQKNWGVIAFDHKKTFPSGGISLDGFSFAPNILGNSLGSVTAQRKNKSFGETLRRLNEWLWNALSSLEGAPKVYVLFDELDAGFDASSGDYKDRIIGLLLAIRATTKAFRKSNLPFHVVAFLRTDIYDELSFGDKNKITDANAATLAWNQALEYESASLKQLIDQRIKEELNLSRREKEPWNIAFDSDVMRGTQHKFHHITSRTFLRPRDVIKFCNSALEEAKKRIRQDSDSALQITNKDMRECRRSYSLYLLSELDDEIAAAYPRWRDYVEVLREIGNTRFTFKQFSAAFKKIGRRVTLDKPETAVLEIFYQYSVVGFQRAAGGAGLIEQFRYIDEQVRFDADAAQFVVHRGLKEALELRDVGDAETIE